MSAPGNAGDEAERARQRVDGLAAQLEQICKQYAARCQGRRASAASDALGGSEEDRVVAILLTRFLRNFTNYRSDGWIRYVQWYQLGSTHSADNGGPLEQIGQTCTCADCTE